MARDGKIKVVAGKPEKEKTGGKKIRKIIFVVIFVLLNALVLFFTAKADFSKEAPTIDYTFSFWNVMAIVGALFCVVVVYAAETMKYVLMMRRLDEKVSVKVAFETVALGKYYDNITPFGAGGQPFQIMHFRKNDYSSGAAAAMPLASFITMQFGFVLLAITVFVFNNKVIDNTLIKITAYVGVVAYTIVPFMIVLSAISPSVSAKIVGFFIRIGGKIKIIKDPQATFDRVEKGLQRYSDSLKFIAKKQTLLIELLGLSILYQVALCSLPFFVIHIFGGEIGFIQALSMCLFVYASITIIPTPGNSGAAEGSFYILFSELDTSGLFWAMLVWRFLCYYSFIITGVGVYTVGAVGNIIRRIRSKGKYETVGKNRH